MGSHSGLFGLSVFHQPLFFLELNLHCILFSIWLIFIVAHLLWRFVLSIFKMKRIDHLNVFQRDCDKEEKRTFRYRLGDNCENSKYCVDSLSIFLQFSSL